MFGMSRQGVYWWMIKFDLPRDTKRGNHKKLKKIAERYNLNMNIGKIRVGGRKFRA